VKHKTYYIEFNKAFFISFLTTTFMKLTCGQQTCADFFCQISSKSVKDYGNYKLFYVGKYVCISLSRILRNTDLLDIAL